MPTSPSSPPPSSRPFIFILLSLLIKKQNIYTKKGESLRERKWLLIYTQKRRAKLLVQTYCSPTQHTRARTGRTLHPLSQYWTMTGPLSSILTHDQDYLGAFLSFSFSLFLTACSNKSQAFKSSQSLTAHKIKTNQSWLRHQTPFPFPQATIVSHPTSHRRWLFSSSAQDDDTNV